MASPSPNKQQSTTAAFRPPSPTKMRTSTKPPSTTSFNPLLPKTPKYPAGARVPRRHESMLSINGSPLANPYDLGISWFNDGDKAEEETDRMQTTNGPARGTLKRSKSIILVRRDPSFSIAPVDSRTKDMFTRTVSQPNLFPGTTSHSRTPAYHSHSQPPEEQTPKHPSQSRSTTFPAAAALVKIPTTDGHVLEFDPLQTSPGQIDALEGITNSAKRQAKDEVGRLVQAAVSKWKIS